MRGRGALGSDAIRVTAVRATGTTRSSAAQSPLTSMSVPATLLVPLFAGADADAAGYQKRKKRVAAQARIWAIGRR